jgi:hypothetical protein
VAGGSVGVGHEIDVPTGWTVATGTSTYAPPSPWSTTWNNAAGKGSWTGPYSTATQFPNSPQGYTITFNGTSWDTGTRDAAYDNGSAGDLDGTQERMGGDFRITVPAGTSAGTYSIVVMGVGHEAGAKSHAEQTITVTVSAAGDTTPPTVTTTVPATGATGVAPNSTYTVNFSESIDCTTVTTSTVTISPVVTWTRTSCSGSQAVFTPSGQANSTLYTVTVGTGVRDLAGNAKASSTNYTYTTAAANAAPTLSVSQPDGTGDTVTQGASYSITYSLADTDNVVTAAFYYDTDNTGLNGTAITGACATAAEGTGVTCSWNTTGVPAGSYYVYGLTSDGVNPQVSAYSPGMITINATVNNPPNVPASLVQYKSDGTTVITKSTYTNQTTVVVKGTVSDPDSNPVTLEVEFADIAAAFTGTPTCSSTAVTSGTTATATCSGLTNGRLKWQARTKDSQSATSAWTQF